MIRLTTINFFTGEIYIEKMYIANIYVMHSKLFINDQKELFGSCELVYKVLTK